MVKAKDELKELGSKWSQKTEKSIAEMPAEIREGEAKTVLFFSFDVVNSTAYKTVNYFNWAQVLNELFKKLREEVENKISDAQMWRLFGDEVVFIVTANSEDEIRNIVDNIFLILMSTRKALKDGEFIKISNDRLKQLIHLQNILSLQATAWIAVVREIDDMDNWQGNGLEDNIFEKHTTKENQVIYEFLGNDIDTGFRISKYTRDGKLTISFELACLIAEVTECASYLNIITYRHLKGVWKDRLYPIIWYHNPKRVQEQYGMEYGCDLQSEFSFDDCENDELIKEYFENRCHKGQLASHSIINERMYTDSYYALQRIIHDRNLKGKIERIKNTLKSTKDKRKYLDENIWLQMHCVAVCYKEDEGVIKILIAKRSQNRQKLPGLWEFGCAKAVTKETIAERIKKEYKEDFNIEIEPIINNDRVDKEPIPLAIYQIPYEDGKAHKGIITLAQISEKSSIDDFRPTQKHTQIKLISEEEIGNYTSQNCVEDFQNTLELAFKKIKALRGEENSNE